MAMAVFISYISYCLSYRIDWALDVFALGIVLWCIAACSETLAMIYYSDHQLFLPMFHGILFLTFITLQIIRQILGQAK